jgi:hypothetical protein
MYKVRKVRCNYKAYVTVYTYGYIIELVDIATTKYVTVQYYYTELAYYVTMLYHVNTAVVMLAHCIVASYLSTGSVDSMHWNKGKVKNDEYISGVIAYRSVLYLLAVCTGVIRYVLLFSGL